MEKMTHEAYEAAREQIRATYGDSSRSSSVRREHALVDLYVRSRWKQEELAEKEQLSQARMAQLLCFGRMLRITQGNNITHLDHGLSESTFRKHYWKRTNPNAPEQERFLEVIAMLEQDAELPKAPRGTNTLLKALHATYGDGTWHGLRPMADKLAVSQEKLQQVLDGLRRTGAHKTFCERRKGGKNDGGWQYRLLPHHGKVIAYDVLKHEFAPLIADIKAESQKNLATAVLGHVGRLAHQLEQLLEKLAR